MFGVLGGCPCLVHRQFLIPPFASAILYISGHITSALALIFMIARFPSPRVIAYTLMCGNYPFNPPGDESVHLVKKNQKSLDVNGELKWEVNAMYERVVTLGGEYPDFGVFILCSSVVRCCTVGSFSFFFLVLLLTWTFSFFNVPLLTLHSPVALL
jgi:hypothetical protein